MRRSILILTVVAVVATVGVGVASVNVGSGYSDVNRQAFAWRRTEVTTNSTDFVPIPGLSGLSVCGSRGVSATVSLQLRGGPAAIRVRMDSGPGTLNEILSPGTVRLEQVSSDWSAWSFTFVKRVSRPFFAPFSVEWKSLAGDTVNLGRGALVVTYFVQRGHVCA
jgi:hypothetical protein